MRTVRSLLALAAMLFLALAAAPGYAPSAGAAQAVTESGTPCINHLFGSGSQRGGKQVTFRARLGAPAGADGVVLELSSDNAAIPVQRKVIIPEGSQEYTFQVVTNPVVADTAVVVTGTTGDCSASKTVTIKAPVLQSLSVQSVMRSGGLGKVTVCLNGRAAASIPVTMTTSDATALPGASFAIPAGSGCVSYKATVGAVASDTPVTVTVTVGTASKSGSTTVKLFPEV